MSRAGKIDGAGNFLSGLLSKFQELFRHWKGRVKTVDVHKLAGLCLMIFGVINVLHAIYEHQLRAQGMSTLYAFVTALLFAGGAALFWRVKFNANAVAKN